MTPLKDALLPADDNVISVFYEFETTQNTSYTDEAGLHVDNLVSVQQFCFRCEDVEGGDCVRCGKRKVSFREYLLVYLQSYQYEPRLWANEFVSIARSDKAFDLHFILNKA